LLSRLCTDMVVLISRWPCVPSAIWPTRMCTTHGTRGQFVREAKWQVIRFPEDDPNGPEAAAHVFEQVKQCLAEVSELALGKVQPYPWL
jgi:hypothetical protein